MGKRFRGLLVLAWVAVVVTLAAVVIMYVLGGPGPEMPDRAQISGALLAAIVMVPPGVWWAWTHRHATVSRTSTSTQVEAAVELLATRTFDYWSREMTRRGIQNPAPVPVRWSWAADDIALRWQDFVASSSLSTDPVPLPGSRFGHGNADQVLDSGLVTQLHEEVYSRLSHGWLVLIGPPGSGKTGAMILLLLEALKHRKQVRRRDRAAVPVPVWLTLGSWDPTSKGLRDWVIETMGRDHEYLRAADFGPDAIGQMFDSRRIALFVDGLYEMPRDFVGRAVERLTTEGGGLRVTISSRPDQYRTTVEAGMQLPFPAVVKLDPVGVKDAADYLLNGSIGSRREAWQKVTDSLEDDPNGVLASTLNTPLTLSLARSAYSRTDPTELLRPALDTEQALRGHLLDQVLVTAYPDSSRRGYTADWLGWCAYQMSELPSGPKRDLQWWAIPNWLSRRQTRLVGALVLGLTFGVVGGVLVQFMDLSARFSFLPGIRLADARAALACGRHWVRPTGSGRGPPPR